MPRRARLTISPLFAAGPAAGVLLLGNTASAHEIIPGVTGFPALMLHPFLLTQQLLGIIIAGLVAGRTKPFAAWPFVFIFGVCLAATQLLIHAVPPDLLYLFLLNFWAVAHLFIFMAAVAVAAFGRFSRTVSIPLFALLAVVISLDIQAEGPAVSDTLQATAATFLTGAVLILAISWAVSRTLPQWAEILTRIIAAWIAASSLMVLALMFR